MFSFSKGQLSIADIWSKGFNLYQKVFAKVWQLSALIFLLICLTDFFIIKIGHKVLQSGSVPYSLMLIGIFLVSFLIILFVSSMMLDFINRLAIDQKATLRISIRNIKQKYFIIIKAALIMAILFFIFRILLQKFNLNWLFLLVYSFGSIFFICVKPEIIINNSSLFLAFKNSINLGFNYWLKIFICMLPLLVFQIISINISHMTFVIHFSFFMVSALLLPYLISLLLVLYHDLNMA